MSAFEVSLWCPNSLPHIATEYIYVGLLNTGGGSSQGGFATRSSSPFLRADSSTDPNMDVSTHHMMRQC